MVQERLWCSHLNQNLTVKKYQVLSGLAYIHQVAHHCKMVVSYTLSQARRCNKHQDNRIFQAYRKTTKYFAYFNVFTLNPMTLLMNKLNINEYRGIRQCYEV